MLLELPRIPPSYLLTGAALASAALVLSSFAGARYGLPGPKGYPVIGSLLDIRPYRQKLQTHTYFYEQSQIYGSIFEVTIMGMTLVIVVDAPSAKRILNTPAALVRDERVLSIFEGFSAKSLFLLSTAQGDAAWKRHRKSLQPAFSPTHLKRVFEATAEIVVHLEAAVRSSIQDKRSLNVFDIFQMLTIDVIGKVAFSENFNSVLSMVDEKAKNPKLVRVGQLINEMETVIVKRIEDPIKPLWSLRGYGHADVERIASPIREFLREIIESKKRAIDSSETKDEKDMDLLDRLLVGQGTKSEKFSDDEIMDEVFGFYFAGHETTTNTLTWMLYDLCQRPHICDRIRQELREVLGNDRPLSWEDISSLIYLDACVKETFRLHPIVCMLGRIATEPVTVLGRTFPPGARLVVEIEALHRSELYWKSPEEYRPERFLEDEIVPGSFLPFGDGQHNCIGQKMAMIEIKVVMANILRHFNFTMTPNQVIEPIQTVTHGLKNGLLIDFEHL
ncbi:cytochrome P450 [Polychytrium aggregatum]|uniref:cytochrome P450 n=1 Tax=Polychytrium aggregatum TaxID=110093 RepID=UPI0022FEA47D|nr:cytochrome P450 [Polychytrium aggregatum]KAI9192924.1 cytochrome P450 [Polychytrium aggregatum]